MTGAWQRDVQRWNEQQGLPIRAIFPSNSFAVGSLEDMMMRGFSNFATVWYSANDNPSLKSLFPKYKFGSYDMVLDREPIVLEWVTSDRPFPLVDAKMLAEHNAHIAALIGTRQVGPCNSVSPPLLKGAVVKSCVVR